jgi:hypothetical protein
MDETLAIVSRMEAYSAPFGMDQLTTDDDSTRRRVRQINASSVTVDETRAVATERHLATLEAALAEQHRDLRQLLDETRRWQGLWNAGAAPIANQFVPATQSWQPMTFKYAAPNVASSSSQPFVQKSAPAAVDMESGNQRQGFQRTSTRKPRGRQSGACHLCGDPLHWKRKSPRREGSASTSAAHGQAATINGVSDKCGSSEIYLMININGKIVPAMVDSGCERGVVPRQYVPKVDLESTNTRLYAVNGNSKPVLGLYEFTFHSE